MGRAASFSKEWHIDTRICISSTVAKREKGGGAERGLMSLRTTTEVQLVISLFPYLFYDRKGTEGPCVFASLLVFLAYAPVHKSVS